MCVITVLRLLFFLCLYLAEHRALTYIWQIITATIYQRKKSDFCEHGKKMYVGNCSIYSQQSADNNVSTELSVSLMFFFIFPVVFSGER